MDGNIPTGYKYLILLELIWKLSLVWLFSVNLRYLMTRSGWFMWICWN